LLRFALLLLLLLSFVRADIGAQQVGVLKIKVTVVDAQGQVRPVPRHALLISENPASAAPQRVVTKIDGTAEARLRAGNYTIESDQPLIFQGKAYEWRATMDVVAGRDTALELTPANAQVEATSAPAAGASGDVEVSRATILADFQDSIVNIWSPIRIGAGFLVDSRGLIATTQRLVGNATSVAVQITPKDRIPGRVMASDPNTNVAIVWIDPRSLPSARPVRLGLAKDGKAPVGENDQVFAIDATLDGAKNVTSGAVARISTHTVVTDLRLDPESAGAPVFTVDGEVVAITTTGESGVELYRVSEKSVRIDEIGAAIADAGKKMTGSAPAGKLPLEPERPADDDALKAAANKRAGSLSPYQVQASDFDVYLLTPPLIYGSQHPPERTNSRDLAREARNPELMQQSLRALSDFGNWSEYVSTNQPVLYIRATPKLVESFWTTVARGAASTQGVAIPAIKHVKTGFSDMRLYCGANEVTPIHPFKIERRLEGGRDIYEGLYVFDPSTLGPECATVKLSLYSEKEPEKADTRTIDSKILEQVRADFAYLAGGVGRR
jgi:S1-C subfamily serine protease